MKWTLLVMAALISLALPAGAEMYKWVDDKGTVHFTDDPSMIPEKYRPNTETRKGTTEPPPKPQEKPTPPPQTITNLPESRGFEIKLTRRNQILLVEGLLNRRVKCNFVVDTGASFTLIGRGTAENLGITIDEYTPFWPNEHGSPAAQLVWRAPAANKDVSGHRNVDGPQQPGRFGVGPPCLTLRIRSVRHEAAVSPRQDLLLKIDRDSTPKPDAVLVAPLAQDVVVELADAGERLRVDEELPHIRNPLPGKGREALVR